MIEDQVSELPEVYQPIYGHPELSGKASRTCEDRLKQIIHIHDTLRREIGRPLKVLDLGCAQGFFSLNLAERGAIVHGVDFLDKNVDVCNTLLGENTDLNASFTHGRVEDVIARLEPDSYDIVLGLSVFHHIVHEHGVPAVKGLLERTADLCGILILELALREEPLYWGPSQPADPSDLLEGIAFVNEVSKHKTHLASIPRPLFVASNRYWVLDDQADEFISHSRDPHQLANNTHQGSRRYFFSSSSVLKQYRFDHPRGAHNNIEYTREVSFLSNPPHGYTTASLIAHGARENDGWLIMERLPGRLLIDLLREGAKVNHRTILLSVLNHLAILEAAGYYHNDVRTWNILVDSDGSSHLIDYGSISKKQNDCVWPDNLFLSFFIFLREVVSGVIDNTGAIRTVSLNPHSMPEAYQKWAYIVWNLQANEWSFELLYKTLKEIENYEKVPAVSSMHLWMTAIEEAIQREKLDLHHHANRLTLGIEHCTNKAQQAHSSADHASTVAQQALSSADHASTVAQQALSSADHASTVAQQALSSADSASSVAQQAFADARQTRELIVNFEAALQHYQHLTVITEQRVNDLLNSTSWRATAPLRWLSTALRKLLSLPWRVVRFGVRALLLPIMRFVLARPGLQHTTSSVLKRFPSVAHRLHLLAIHRGLMPAPPLVQTPATTQPQPAASEPKPHSPARYAAIELMLDAEASLNSKDHSTAIVYLDIK